MPVPLRNNAEPIPKLNHAALETTFVGLEHSLSTSDVPVHQYRGIKYASVPGRFRQSRLWSNYPMITDASKHGPICPQIRSGRSVEEAMLGLPAFPKEHFTQDEFECLNLTVTCPAGLTPQSRLPVMLWIHGGGDRGHGSHWIYDGGALVRKSITINKPVILVAINFRIGLFGFAASSLLREDKAIGDEGVGNYGLRDQRRAMEWLHQYIDGFGGDPNNITLFGSSTGGADIICHLLSVENEIRPLFHRAVVQSAIFDPVIPDVSAAGWRLSRAMAALHVTTAKDFKALEANKLVGAGLTYRAVDDGSFFRQGWQDYFGEKPDTKPKSQLLRAVRSGSRRVSRSSSRGLRSASRSVSTPQSATSQLQPLVIGDCACDSHLWSVAASLWSSTSVFRRLRAVCQTLVKSNSLLRAYDISSYTPDDEIVDRVLDLINDARVAWPTEHVAQISKRERAVYRYVFDQETPSRGVPHHAADLVYLFDNVPLDIVDNEPPTSIKVIDNDSPKITTTPTPTAAPTPQIPARRSSSLSPTTTTARGRVPPRTLRECPSESDFDEDMDLLFDDSDSDESVSTPRTEDDFDWMRPIVDEWSYSRVRDAIQERWIAFAHGDAPWKEDRVFVFGPEGETGERSMSIFEGRRRSKLWKEALEPLGASLVHKIGVELSRGP
ncbi:hypothetical protein APHAL10511_006964 [Amanita phalloides]|nr:hypothetical protein APHAL10511_006964 [Amanita phalloides]